eukprot:CAMPEP_0197432710 /NCGR_PEP_ID=MMETSP1175-20131217/737_1 /TAXON_ID=1003142 /ORGANISM="Triceratium dubium, Strain CCMP147" /LENGTH=378 /DNA_ID=CAMNT_0042960867 /DNA_START=107 /DNA_END=1243 /DNA_ORIENTATION=+
MIFGRSSLALVLALASSVSAGSSDSFEGPSPLLRASKDDAVAKIELMTDQFLEWASTHNKDYQDDDEQRERMHIWLENHEFIERHNNQIPKPSYTLGHNQFSDLTHDEYKQRHFLGEYSPGVDTTMRDKKWAQENLVLGEVAEDDSSASNAVEKKLPKSVDWVEKGGVTPIKNQGACGSCWAFSAIGAIEGAHFIKTGELVSLSEQELVDCDIHDKGCNGGLMDIAFEFDEKGRGICTEEDYPYEAKRNTNCNTECTPVDDTVVASFHDIRPGDAKELKASIAEQPTSIAIEAKQMIFQFYKSGVLDNDDCGKNAAIDHGVLVVGYGKDEDSGLKYWLVKNSWGDTWGDKGYVKLAQKSENRYGTCAILRLPSAPKVA